MDIKGKTVFITGANRGIGLETAKLFKEAGADVIAGYRTKTPDIGTKYQEIDLTSEQSIKNAVKGIPPIDILINNAGVVQWNLLADQTDEEIKEQIQANLLGPILLTRHILPKLNANGIIINIGSGAAKTGYDELAPYCATKFGLRGFTQALSKGIRQRVYQVNPGMTKTRMTDFQGESPENVARVILETAKETLNKSSGDDVDVWEYRDHKMHHP